VTEERVEGILWRGYGTDGTDGADGANGANGSDRRSGGASPLVILHGLFGAGDNWRSQAMELAEERPVLVADLPNHGGSDHTDEVAYAAVAARIWRSLDGLAASLGVSGPAGVSLREDSGAPRFVLLGHSMGGKVAMAMAFARPGQVERLIVADIAPRPYPPRHDEIFAAMEAVAAGHVERRGEADAVMEKWIPEKAVRLFLLKSLVPGSDGKEGYRWQLNLPGLKTGYEAIRDWPFRDESYDGPTLFIAGGKSPYIQVEDGEAISRHFPDHRIETIPGAGHWLHAEARDAFLDVVRGHLS
jgi:esterase